MRSAFPSTQCPDCVALSRNNTTDGLSRFWVAHTLTFIIQSNELGFSIIPAINCLARSQAKFKWRILFPLQDGFWFYFNVSHLPDWPFTGWFLCWSWATMFHWRTPISLLWLGMNKSNKYSSNWKKNWNPSRASSGTASAWTSGSCCLVAFSGQWPLMVSHFNSKLWSLDVISCSTG